MDPHSNAEYASDQFASSSDAPHSCTLCPRVCGAARAGGERGVCGAGADLVVARAALHFWEEPPISGTAGSGTVFFCHCPLRCLYCQNHEIAAGNGGTTITVYRLAEIFLELQAQGALNVNLVTPTHYIPQIKLAIEQAREGGLSLPIVYNTSGYESVEAIQSLAGYIDIYLTDFKYWSPNPARAYSHAPDYRKVALAALDAMVAQTGPPVYREAAAKTGCVGDRSESAGDGEGPLLARGVIVRHLMLPGQLEDSKAIVACLADRYGDAVAISIMNQYTPLRSAPEHPELDERVSDAAYEELLSFADFCGIEEYFWQEGDAVGESFIPPFDGTGVESRDR